MYLVNLSHTQNSPSWFMARKNIAERHHISEFFIGYGTQELRKLNLLEIQYGQMPGGDYEKRLANVYIPKPLYDPAEFAKRMGALAQKYGKEKLARAVGAAAAVFEENNVLTVQALIDLEDKYGQAAVEKAVSIVSQKSPENPRSHPITILGKRDALWRAETKPEEAAVSGAIRTPNTAKSQADRMRRSPRRVMG